MKEREFIAKEWRDDNGILHRREVGQELVRCKECKLGGTEDCPMDEIDDEYFCNFGEREGE